MAKLNIQPKVILSPKSIKLADVPDDVYFSDKYKNFVSNSKLGLINPKQNGSPEKYIKGFDNSFNSSFVLGDAIHKLILQPEDYFLVKDLNKPSAKMGVIADLVYEKYSKTKDYLEAVKYGIVQGNYYKGSLSENNINKVSEECKEYVLNRDFIEIPKDKEAIFLDIRSLDTVEKCVNNVNNNNDIQELLKDSGLFNTINSCEECVTAEFIVKIGNKEVPIAFKGKVDHYSFIDNYLLQVNDLKSTGRDVDLFGEHSFYNYHYYRQMAIYTWLLASYYKQQHKNIEINNPKMLLVSTIPPNNCGIFEVSKDHIQMGLAEFKDLMCRVAICEIFGYNTEILEDFAQGKMNKDFMI